MGITEKDIQDTKLARPAAVVDMWDIDDRVDRLEDVAERLERVLAALIHLFKQARAMKLEELLRGMIEEQPKGVGNGSSTRARDH